MTEFTVAFFGHRYISNQSLIEERLQAYIEMLLREKEYVTFLVGRNGEFDQYAASAVLRAKKNLRDDNSSLILVLPYMTADCMNNKNGNTQYYDEIEVSHNAEKAHPKSAIQIRNREMVDRADLILCYIERNQGGAFTTIRYAQNQNKNIVNLAEGTSDLLSDKACQEGSFSRY